MHEDLMRTHKPGHFHSRTSCSHSPGAGNLKSRCLRARFPLRANANLLPEITAFLAHPIFSQAETQL